MASSAIISSERTPERTPDRLAFLDALRGVAASAVVLEHGLGKWVPGFEAWAVRYFDLGQFGVSLFLLISGFIIPISLERGGSNTRFWISRLFRLFPLYWVTVAYLFFYNLAVTPDAFYPPHAWQWLVNLTMLQEFARVPHVAGVFWTLTLELLFYVSCSVLYQLGLLRRTWLMVWLGQALLVLLAVCGPLLLNKRFPGGYAFLFLTMFMGTMFSRYVHGQISGRAFTLLLASLAPVSLAVSYVNFELFARNGLPFTFHCVWTLWLAAYVVFGLVLSRRDLPMPGWLCYLGRISYSIYLVHTWLILAVPQHWPAPLALTVLIGGTLAVSTLTYYLIEKPFMILAKRLLARASVEPGKIAHPRDDRPSSARAA